MVKDVNLFGLSVTYAHFEYLTIMSFQGNPTVVIQPGTSNLVQ